MPVSALLTISSTYLAWHYTGQAWGMIATFTYLEGASFNPLERRLVRGSLYILMAWHVVWFFHLGYHDYVDLTPVYEGLSLLTAVALAMGLTGFSLHKARTGRFAPLRAWIPCVAIFAWYAAMARVGLAALFIVQIAHALQFAGARSLPGAPAALTPVNPPHLLHLAVAPRTGPEHHQISRPAKHLATCRLRIPPFVV